MTVSPESIEFCDGVLRSEDVDSFYEERSSIDGDRLDVSSVEGNLSAGGPWECRIGSSLADDPLVLSVFVSPGNTPDEPELQRTAQQDQLPLGPGLDGQVSYSLDDDRSANSTGYLLVPCDAPGAPIESFLVNFFVSRPSSAFLSESSGYAEAAELTVRAGNLVSARMGCRLSAITLPAGPTVPEPAALVDVARPCGVLAAGPVAPLFERPAELSEFHEGEWLVRTTPEPTYPMRTCSFGGNGRDGEQEFSHYDDAFVSLYAVRGIAQRFVAQEPPRRPAANPSPNDPEFVDLRLDRQCGDEPVSYRLLSVLKPRDESLSLTSEQLETLFDLWVASDAEDAGCPVE